MWQKYIIGDVVMYDNKIMVVKEPRDGIHFDLSCHKEGLVYCFVDMEKTKPVKLNSLILQKNGWKKDEEGYINDSCHLHLCEKYDGYSVYKVVNDNVVWLTGVRNVSDLQHLLFGLGIKHEMEV